MGLVKYRQKRSFDRTPEPKGGKNKGSDLRFVIQKHAASHLHYDFRLEMEGVLKSWAVPKGPSTDPSIKRLAMMVEDHPFDYRNFEGIIPKGNYGAGTVIVWDEGTYEPWDTEEEFTDKKSMERNLLHQLHSGKLKFFLHGKKLKGAFALVKASGRGENAWLLMKITDKFASENDILEKDKSVVSHKTLEQVSRQAEKEEKKVSRTRASPPEKKAVKKKSLSPLPVGVRPMLATLTDEPFDRPGWVYEIKWDGYRALAFADGKNSMLKSRNDKSFNDKFYPVFEAVKSWDARAIVDGEIVVVDEKGHSNFGALQNWRSEADGELLYYVFDLLWLDGKWLTGLPLTERKKKLAEIIPKGSLIKLSENFEATGTEFFVLAQQMGLEGIIAKKADSLYYPDVRTRDWLKIKVSQRQEVVIGGFTKNEGTPKPFSALLVGVYENGELVYTGKIGTGFNHKTQLEMLERFRPLITDKIPFAAAPDVNQPSRFRPNPPRAEATWLKPQLVCEVSFTEMTSDGIMRHPSFEGMRIDKKAKEVRREIAVPVEKAIPGRMNPKTRKLLKGKATNARKTLLNPKEETQEKIIGGHKIKFTNLSKIFWPEEKYTKRDLLNYYYHAAPFILPYLKDRPQSLNRHPNGIYGKSFYQKDVMGKAPEWIATYPYYSEADDREKEFLVCTDEASLMYMISLGCIEVNPWSSRAQSPDHPDWCIIDLDPDQNSFNQVIEAARVTKDVLDSFDMPSYCKTSGSSGLHIYIPLGAKYTYEQSKEFARVIVTLVNREIPEFTTIERVVSNRGGKMYLDFLQNRPQATLAAPYSVRPKPGATVSMPLFWEEVKQGLKMSDFTLANAIGRMRSVGDIFKPVLGKGIDLEAFVRRDNG